jgi:phosphoribosylanthranilate isomerase
MWIKICANTNLADAQLAAELGADAVGFVFAPSRRQVTPEEVAAITPHLPGNIEKVGVFHPGDDETLDEAIAISGLTALQLHGDFSEWAIDGLLEKTEGKLKLIQVVGFDAQAADHKTAHAAFADRLVQASTNPAISSILIDTVKSGASGGLGVAFDWAAAARVLDSVAPKCNIILAGGLRGNNVAEAIATLHPFGVDVASGVEEIPGRKDPEKLRNFVHAARGSVLPQ